MQCINDNDLGGAAATDDTVIELNIEDLDVDDDTDDIEEETGDYFRKYLKT